MQNHFSRTTFLEKWLQIKRLNAFVALKLETQLTPTLALSKGTSRKITTKICTKKLKLRCIRIKSRTRSERISSQYEICHNIILICCFVHQLSPDSCEISLLISNYAGLSFLLFVLSGVSFLVAMVSLFSRVIYQGVLSTKPLKTRNFNLLTKVWIL